MTKAQRFRKQLGEPGRERVPVLCLRTPNTTLHIRCHTCAEEPPVVHQPIKLGGKFCAACCPCCTSVQPSCNHHSETR